jgi:hypothetical protein
MNDVTLLLAHPPTLEEFAAFVDAFPGGAWWDQSSPPSGTIQDELHHVVLTYDPNFREYVEHFADDPFRDAMVAHLGKLPEVAISIGWGLTAAGSRPLAMRVARECALRWGSGCLVDEAGACSSLPDPPAPVHGIRAD